MLWMAGAIFTVSVPSMRNAVGRAFHLGWYLYAKLLICYFFQNSKGVLLSDLCSQDSL